MFSFCLSRIVFADIKNTLNFKASLRFDCSSHKLKDKTKSPVLIMNKSPGFLLDLQGLPVLMQKQIRSFFHYIFKKNI
jgi:hypothetical protein